MSYPIIRVSIQQDNRFSDVWAYSVWVLLNPFTENEALLLAGYGHDFDSCAKLAQKAIRAYQRRVSAAISATIPRRSRAARRAKA